MKFIKMMVLAGATTIAMGAVMGASSAMAGNTQLCTNDPCTTAATSVHLVDPLEVRLSTLFGVHREVLCQVLFQGTVLALGAPQVIHGSFTFTLPHSSSGSCFEMLTDSHCDGDIEDLNGGLLLVLRTTTELAKVTGDDFEWLVECAGLHCVYIADELEWHALGPLLAGGGTNGKMTISEQNVVKKEGFLCPSTTKLTTVLENLSPTYIGT